jgi:hypothetical protein
VGAGCLNGRVGQLSDPYNQGEEDQDLTISGLPEDPKEPDVSDGASGVDLDDESSDEPEAVDEPDADDRGVEGAAGGEASPGADDDGDSESDDELEEEVAYNLDDFDDDQLDALFDALDEEAIPYLWDGDELFVQAADEQAVDVLLERVANPDALAVEDDEGDGGGWLLGELFVVADRLQHDPEEHESVALLLQLANAADEADPPYGLDKPVWEQLRERVTALATILEQDKPDPDAALESARELRNAIRPYV